MVEEWRPVVGWEGFYEVSSIARIRSLPRVLTKSNGRLLTIPGRMLSPFPLPSGYLFVNLKRGNTGKLSRVHRLVAEAFIPNPHELPQVLHWDDDRSNNRVENLRWGTDRENKADRLRNGRNPNFNKTHCKHGHEFTETNTYNRPDGRGRECRECHADRRMKKRRRNP